MNLSPILCVVSSPHWPLPGFDGYAKPAYGAQHVAAQFMVNARMEKQLRGMCVAVLPYTSDGLRAGQRRFPDVDWSKLGAFWGTEILADA